MANDRAQVVDSISASIEKEAVPPVFPCPDCGAETREHGEAQRYDESERICSAATCRHVQTACDEAARRGPADESPRFPCCKCGRETKVHKAGRIEGSRQRICTSCKKIIDA